MGLGVVITSRKPVCTRSPSAWEMSTCGQGWANTNRNILCQWTERGAVPGTWQELLIIGLDLSLGCGRWNFYSTHTWNLAVPLLRRKSRDVRAVLAAFQVDLDSSIKGSSRFSSSYCKEPGNLCLQVMILSDFHSISSKIESERCTRMKNGRKHIL